jgi:zinc transport system substrate-binding protein
MTLPVRAGLFAALIATPLHAEVPRVVTDIAPVHALVAQVMEGVGEPTVLMPRGSDPHGYALRPSEAAALADADLVFWIGAELTPALARSLDTLGEGAEVITLLEHTESGLFDFREGALFEDHDHGHGDPGSHDEDAHGHDEHGQDEHAHDDHGHDEQAHDEHAHDDHGHDDHAHAHDGADPHAWLDPRNGAAWLGTIAEALAAADPANAETYRGNAAEGRALLAETEDRIAERVSGLDGVPFVVFHDKYQYFERRFGIGPVAPLSLADNATPGAARLAEIRDAVAERGIRCAVIEPQTDRDLVAAVVEDATVGVVDPLKPDAGPGYYAALLDETAQAFAACR